MSINIDKIGCQILDVILGRPTLQINLIFSMISASPIVVINKCIKLDNFYKSYRGYMKSRVRFM